MANWINVSIDLDKIPEGEFKGLLIDWQGNSLPVDLPYPYKVPFIDTQYIETQLSGFSYRVYEKKSNNDGYEYYDDITDSLSISIRIKDDIKTLIIKSDRKPISGYVHIY